MNSQQPYNRLRHLARADRQDDLLQYRERRDVQGKVGGLARTHRIIAGMERAERAQVGACHRIDRADSQRAARAARRAR